MNKLKLLVVILFFILNFYAGAEKLWTTGVDGLKLRENSSYDSSVITIIPYGEEVRNPSNKFYSNWIEIEWNDYKGYVSKAFLSRFPVIPINNIKIVENLSEAIIGNWYSINFNPFSISPYISSGMFDEDEEDITKGLDEITYSEDFEFYFTSHEYGANGTWELEGNILKTNYDTGRRDFSVHDSSTLNIIIYQIEDNWQILQNLPSDLNDNTYIRLWIKPLNLNAKDLLDSLPIDF
jgi:uncharacterized protein YgiM (DUF1202 family)